MEEPYLLTSLIRRLTELLHEHGDLPIYTTDEGEDIPVTQVKVELEYQLTVHDHPKRVVLS